MNAAKCLSESAVERIPIELWSKIINFLLRSPLVPHQDTTFVESLAMLSYGCDSEDLVRGWVQTSLPLRLVCHGWNLLVQRAAPILVRCNFDDRHVTAVPANVLPQPSDADGVKPELLKAHRLESWCPFVCTCVYQCRSSLPSEQVARIYEKDEQDYEENYGQSEDGDDGRNGDEDNNRIDNQERGKGENRTHWDSHFFVPTQDLIKLKVFIADLYLPADSPIPLLNCLTDIKVLSWPLVWSEQHFKSVVRHYIHQQLTHVKLHLVWSQINDLEYPISFPNLLFLDVFIEEAVGQITPPKPGGLTLANWATFPQLCGLRLALDPHDHRREEFLLFLKGVGVNLQSLLLGLPRHLTEWFIPEVWELLPSLIEFGVESDFISTIEYPPPPLATRPLNLLYRVYDYATEFGSFPDDYVPMDDFLKVCQTWRINQMTMLETWREAKSALLTRTDASNECNLPVRVEFYERLAVAGVTIRDRDGIAVTEPLGQRFIDALKSISGILIN